MTNELQAIVVALLFGVDAGISASEGTTLHVGGMSVVKVSEGARALLAQAQAIVERMEPTTTLCGLVLYDVASKTEAR